MVAVAGHWEIGYMTPIIEHYMWAIPMWDLGVTEWYMHPVSGIFNTVKKVNLHEKKDVNEILKDTQDLDLTRVYVEPSTYQWTHDGTLLPEFEHPENALYLFGSAHFNPMIAHFRKNKDRSVIIPTVQNAGLLWGNQAMITILYDRVVKRCLSQ
jgi:hypothetical protein